MNDLGISLLGASARVTVLALVGLAIVFAFRRRGPSAVVLVTFWTLSSLLVVSALSLSPWPRFWDLDLATGAGRGEPTLREPAAEAEARVASPETVAPQHGVRNTRLADFVNEFLREVQKAGTAPAVADSGRGWRWPAWVSLGLMVGVGLGLARLALAFRSVASLRRRSEPIADPSILEELDCLRAALGCVRPVELRTSAALATAATVGWRRPLVLLPADWRRWTDEERRAALAHELAHVRAGDYVSGVWAHVCLSTHFYHPLAHWLVARLRLEQELAADALAARVSGGSRPYLESLARLALRRPGPIESRPMAGLWPARPFLPTRGTLLRRIEMLRDPKSNPTRTEPLSWPGRVSAFTALAVAGLALAGLRGPAFAQGPQAERRTSLALADTANASSSDVFDLSRAPAATVLAVVGKPSSLLRRPEFKALVDALKPPGNTMWNAGWVPPDEIETVVALLMRDFAKAPPAGGMSEVPMSWTVRATRPLDWKRIETVLGADAERAHVEGAEIIRSKAMHYAFVKFDDRTVGIGPESVLRQVITARKGGPIKHAWDEPWSKVKKGQVALAVDTTAFTALLPKDVPPGAAQAKFTAATGLVQPLLEKASAYGLGVNLDKGMSLDLVATTSSDEAAAEVADTLKAVAVLGKNSIESLRRQIPPNEEQGRRALAMLDAVEPLLKSVKTEVSGSVVELHAATDQDVAKLVAPLAPAVVAARAAGRSVQSMNNMKQIAIAMHNYQDANGHFPPPAPLGSDGKTPHSWRVALLPFLDQEELYKQYRFNEPWDSPANRLVLAKMPAVYRHPSADASDVGTAYVVPVGAETMFPPQGTGTKVAEIFDGTSNTIMVVEAKTGIPWTKPEDLPVSIDRNRFDAPGAKIPTYSADGFVAALADGSARVIATTNPPDLLNALFTRASGEAFDWSKVLPLPGQPPAVSTPAR